MSKWTDDINMMHDKYGVHKWVYEKLQNGDTDTLQKFIQFRLEFLQEELNETQDAFEAGDPKEIVDGLIDLCVIAIGTLDAFGCDSDDAWNEVLRANMDKQVGVKATRPNPLGLPDLIKPDGWKGPDHTGLTGDLDRVFEDENKIREGH